MKVRLILVVCMLGWLLSVAAGVQAAQPANREKLPGTAVQTTTAPAKSEQLSVRTVSVDPSGEETEIYSADGYIYIRSVKRQEFKVFTILGQMVQAGHAGPGLTEIQMQTRGIYIVKVGTVTQRVAL